MRTEQYTGTTEEEWGKFKEDHAIAEYGDPVKTLENLDRLLQKEGKEIVIVHNEGPDCHFRIADKEE